MQIWKHLLSPYMALKRRKLVSRHCQTGCLTATVGFVSVLTAIKCLVLAHKCSQMFRAGKRDSCCHFLVAKVTRLFINYASKQATSTYISDTLFKLTPTHMLTCVVPTHLVLVWRIFSTICCVLFYIPKKIAGKRTEKCQLQLFIQKQTQHPLFVIEQMWEEVKVVTFLFK